MRMSKPCSTTQHIKSTTIDNKASESRNPDAPSLPEFPENSLSENLEAKKLNKINERQSNHFQNQIRRPKVFFPFNGVYYSIIINFIYLYKRESNSGSGITKPLFSLIFVNFGFLPKLLRFLFCSDFREEFWKSAPVCRQRKRGFRPLSQNFIQCSTKSSALGKSRTPSLLNRQRNIPASLFTSPRLTPFMFP